MFTFETTLKKIKHEVLKQIALLAINDNLTTKEIFNIHKFIVDEDTAMYRCCVFKERAIVNQRAKLAAGYMPIDDEYSDLIDIRNSDQIMYIIEAACDRCPINKYTVTEACRGCITHKCKEVCPANAMMTVSGKSYINQDLCKECGLCKKVCPYNAISEVLRPCKIGCPTGALSVNDHNRRAIIKNEDCVQCGACMTACPFGAISDKSLIVPVAKRLHTNKPMVAIVAPSISGQFGQDVSIGKVKSALKSMGFKDMYEASCGADIVTIHEANEFAERMENGDSYMTNSCCPGFFSYIEKKFPSEVSRISNTVSPMIAMARLLKSKDPDVKVVFIGPCTAKKAEAKRADVAGAVDYVLTFEELTALFDAFNVNPSECAEDEVNDGSIFGRGFGMAGGLTASVENYIKTENITAEFKPIKVSGPLEIKRALTLGKVNKLQGNFIEGMMCNGGCINGAGVFSPPDMSKTAFVKEGKLSSVKNVIDNKTSEDIESISMDRN
ncbi:MAG: 4Fe-4S dicluster domain-containing protein [Clostridium sp.]|uniref:4Fe-4S dicluster domain-containing protein n=1 Tax=Clostridium sp. TaxID=1506 RepID=UPI0032163FEE